jgi:transcriptional regulator with XRE-family HTH domain
MISANQLRAARALLGIDQRQLADLARLSVPTIQRMEASGGVIRGNVDSLTKLLAAFDAAGVEIIGENVLSPGGGRGVRLKGAPAKSRGGKMQRLGPAVRVTRTSG